MRIGVKCEDDLLVGEYILGNAVSNLGTTTSSKPSASTAR